MKMIQAVSINNYRGLAATEVQGLGRVNVVVGRNGAGKTTLLEALALACLGNQPEQLLWVSLSRGGILNRGSIESIFGTPGMPAEIKLNTAAGEYALTIQPPKTSQSYLAPHAGGTDALKQELELMLTNQHPTANGGQAEHRHRLKINTGGEMTVEKESKCAECIQAFYLPCRIVNHSMVRGLVSKLSRNGDEARLVEILRLCDERVRDVRLIEEDILVELEGKVRLPLASLGDGANRLALMADGLLNEQVSVLLLDEIDSGLHHSVMEAFWEHLLVLMEERPFQIFCTTHDEEMLEATLAPFLKHGRTDWLRKVAVTRRPSGEVALTVSDYEELCYQVENQYPTRT